MNFSIDHGPSFAWLKVSLDAGESIQAEAGARRSKPSLIETFVPFDRDKIPKRSPQA